MCVIWLNDRLLLQMPVPVHTPKASHEVLYICMLESSLILGNLQFVKFSFQHFKRDILVLFFISIFISDSEYLFMNLLASGFFFFLSYRNHRFTSFTFSPSGLLWVCY